MRLKVDWLGRFCFDCDDRLVGIVVIASNAATDGGIA